MESMIWCGDNLIQGASWNLEEPQQAVKEIMIMELFFALTVPITILKGWILPPAWDCYHSPARHDQIFEPSVQTVGFVFGSTTDASNVQAKLTNLPLFRGVEQVLIRT